MDLTVNITCSSPLSWWEYIFVFNYSKWLERIDACSLLKRAFFTDYMFIQHTRHLNDSSRSLLFVCSPLSGGRLQLVSFLRETVWWGGNGSIGFGCLNGSKWTKCFHLYPADNGSASTLEEHSIDPIRESQNGLPNFISFTWGICNFVPPSVVGSEEVERDGGGQLKSCRQIALLWAREHRGWEFNQDLLKLMVSL